MKAGANVNARSFDGVTPLHDAVSSEHYQVIEKIFSVTLLLSCSITFRIAKFSKAFVTVTFVGSLMNVSFISLRKTETCSLFYYQFLCSVQTNV